MAGALSKPFISFNQDSTCISVANEDGILIFSLEANKVVFSAPLGSIRMVQMLHSTSLLAYVGSGEEVTSSARRLSLLNTTTQSVIHNLTFPSTILAVRLNRKRLVAVLVEQAFVYELDTLELLATIPTPANPQGVCALSAASYLALPSKAGTGRLRVSNALEGSNVLAELEAHKSAVAALAWNHDGKLLASASDKGTVIRLHALPKAAKAYTLRRGTTEARINCLAFSGPGMGPQLLAAASSHGTVHIWNLEAPSLSRRDSGVLASVASIAQRCLINIRLPSSGVPAVCALQAKETPPSSQILDRGTGASQEGAATLLVVSEAADLYSFRMQDLQGNQPSSSLEHTCMILEGER